MAAAVAQATGIPKATLYYYFTGKEEILAHLLAEGLRAIADAVTIAADGRGTARQRLRAVIEAQLRVMSEHPAVCRALISELGRAGRIPEIAAAVADAYYTPVRRLLAAGAADGSLPPGGRRRRGRQALFGAVTITGLRYLVAGNEIPAAAAKRLTTLVVDGLATNRGAPLSAGVAWCERCRASPFASVGRIV